MFNLKVKKKPRAGNVQIQFDRAFLEKVAKVIRDEIVKEAQQQAARDPRKASERTSVNEDGETISEGIPRSQQFFNSFHYRIFNNAVEIYSDWPWITQIVEGRDPYKMTWLTRSQGVDKVPFHDPLGKVIIRSTPLNAEDAWIHPGFAKHDFFTVGWQNALPKVRSMYAQETLRLVLKRL